MDILSLSISQEIPGATSFRERELSAAINNVHVKKIMLLKTSGGNFIAAMIDQNKILMTNRKFMKKVTLNPIFLKKKPRMFEKKLDKTDR